MKTQDWLQLASLAVVVVALFFSYRQTKTVTQQAGDAARQAAATASSLEHAAYRTVSAYGADMHEILFSNHPGVAQWFLESRHIPTGSHEENLKLIFVFQRMDVHEAAFVSHRDGFLAPDIWVGWERVIERDAATPEFQRVWRVVRDQFAREFAEHIDAVVASSIPAVRSGTVPLDRAATANGASPAEQAGGLN